MVWKQDLAKLKQQLGEAPVPPPPKPVPKPADKPLTPADLNTEDALFLAAMGRRQPRPAPARIPEVQAAPVEPPPPPPDTFAEAVADLKGLKPLVRPAVRPKPTPPSPPPLPAPVLEAPVPLAEPHTAPPPAAETASPPPLPSRPVRFQLAAGMALEVDGLLDLRGHSRQDAIERLKDRLADGLLLGWRSVQVLLGTDPELHGSLLALLESGEAPMITRYAQAPVPMGGAQAWLLYFAPPA